MAILFLLPHPVSTRAINNAKQQVHDAILSELVCHVPTRFTADGILQQFVTTITLNQRLLLEIKVEETRTKQDLGKVEKTKICYTSVELKNILLELIIKYIAIVWSS